MVEQDEMVSQKDSELVDDLHAARLPDFVGNELLGSAIAAPVNVNPVAIEIDGGNVERKQLAESRNGVDGEAKRGPRPVYGRD